MNINVEFLIKSNGPYNFYGDFYRLSNLVIVSILTMTPTK